MGGHFVAVSWCMPPALFPRSIQIGRLLKGLKRIGWAGTVITPDVAALGSDTSIDPALAETYQGQFDLSSVDLRRADAASGTWLDRWRDRMRGEDALSDEELWVKRAAAAVRRAAASQAARALITFAQPWRDHLVGLAWPRHDRLPWIAHFSDPWVDSLYSTDQPEEWQARERRREAQVVEQADAIVFTNKYAADLVMAKYPAALRVKSHVVPHAMDSELLPGADRLLPHAGAATPRPLRLFHVGNLFQGRRTARALFDGLAAIDRKQPLAGRLEVVFVGAGSGLYEAREQVFVRALESVVSFRPRVAHLESLAAMRESDALLLIDALADTNVFLPSKVVDYLMAERPIVALTPAVGPTADLMREAGYPVIAPADAGAIANAIDAMLDEANARGLSPSPRAATAAEAYSLSRTSAAFARILDHVAGART